MNNSFNEMLERFREIDKKRTEAEDEAEDLRQQLRECQARLTVVERELTEIKGTSNPDVAQVSSATMSRRRIHPSAQIPFSRQPEIKSQRMCDDQTTHFNPHVRPMSVPPPPPHQARMAVPPQAGVQFPQQPQAQMAVPPQALAQFLSQAQMAYLPQALVQPTPPAQMFPSARAQMVPPLQDRAQSQPPAPTQQPLHDQEVQKICMPLKLMMIHDSTLEAPETDQIPPNGANANDAAAADVAVAAMPLSKSVYLFGGFAQANKPQNTVEKLHDGRMWQEVAKIPEDINPVHNTAIAYDEGIAFLFSGFPSTNYQNTILKFNSRNDDSNMWEWIMPHYGRCLAAHARWGHSICIAGGYACDPEYMPTALAFPFPANLTDMSMISTVELFDPINDSWSFLPSLLEPRIRCTLVPTSPNVIYCLGGLLPGNENCLRPTNSVERYDRRMADWKRVNPMKQRRAMFDAVEINGNIMAMGGIIANVTGCPKLETAATNSMEMYDARNETWMTLDTRMPTYRCAFTSHVFNEDELYIIGGQCSVAQPRFKHIQGVGMDRFSFNSNTWIDAGMLAGTSSKRYAHASCVL